MIIYILIPTKSKQNDGSKKRESAKTRSQIELRHQPAASRRDGRRKAMKTARATSSLGSQSPNSLSLFYFIFCVCALRRRLILRTLAKRKETRCTGEESKRWSKTDEENCAEKASGCRRRERVSDQETKQRLFLVAWFTYRE